MPVINSVAAMKDEIAALRRDLHRHPQTSYEETYAAALVARQLTAWGIPFESGIAVTGIVATIEGQKSDSGKAVGLRADMDALDITEKSGREWASTFPGKMHACGHDGHTSILLGAAKYLSENRNFNGKVHLIFQPAEEGGGGAYKMIEEGLFKKFPMDAVYGLHNWPYMKIGQIGTRKGPLMASSDSLTITIKGVGGHAAMPHKTVDPIVVASHIVTALQSIVSRNVDPVDQAVVTITNLNAGTGAFNIIGDSAVMSGTVRAFTRETRKFLHDRLRAIVQSVAAAFMAEAEVEIFDGYDPTINSDREAEIAAAAAAAVVGEANVHTNIPPVMGAEDFGAYTAEKPGAFIFLGQGVDEKDSPHNYGLHNPHYDFNDDAIPVGVSYFAKLVEELMPLK